VEGLSQQKMKDQGRNSKKALGGMDSKNQLGPFFSGWRGRPDARRPGADNGVCAAIDSDPSGRVSLLAIGPAYIGLQKGSKTLLRDESRRSFLRI